MTEQDSPESDAKTSTQSDEAEAEEDVAGNETDSQAGESSPEQAENVFGDPVNVMRRLQSGNRRRVELTSGSSSRLQPKLGFGGRQRRGMASQQQRTVEKKKTLKRARGRPGSKYVDDEAGVEGSVGDESEEGSESGLSDSFIDKD